MALIIGIIRSFFPFCRPDKKGKGESVRRDGGARPPNYLAHHAKQTPGNLAKEARDTVKSIKALLEEERKSPVTWPAPPSYPGPGFSTPD